MVHNLHMSELSTLWLFSGIKYFYFFIFLILTEPCVTTLPRLWIRGTWSHQSLSPIMLFYGEIHVRLVINENNVKIVMSINQSINQSIWKCKLNMWIKNSQGASLIYHTLPIELKWDRKQAKQQIVEQFLEYTRQSDGWSEVYHGGKDFSPECKGVGVTDGDNGDDGITSGMRTVWRRMNWMRFTKWSVKWCVIVDNVLTH